MKIWTPCTTFLWHLKLTTQKRPVGLKKYVKILSLMLCIWFSNGKTMSRFITISQSEQKEKIAWIGGKSLLSRKTFDAQETSVWSFSEKYSRFFHLRPMHLPELALLSSHVIWRLVGTNSSQAKELRRISKQKFICLAFRLKFVPMILRTRGALLKRLELNHRRRRWKWLTFDIVQVKSTRIVRASVS